MKTLTDSNITICGHGSGNPSTKNLHSYSVVRYNQKAPNGKHKGIVEVRRYKGMSDADRRDFTHTYQKILGRNIYSQTKRQYVYNKASDGKYYSDCSSSGMATYQKIGLNPGGLLNTAGIHNSSKFETINVTISNGCIKDPWKLEIGDCILFVGSDPSRPRQIGHVEYVYGMPGAKYKISVETAAIRKKKDQTATIVTRVHKGDKVRIIEDCKDGWSLGTDGNVIGYIKNSTFDCATNSTYPKGTVTADCKMHAKNAKASKVTHTLKVDSAIKIVTMHKYWTYVIASEDDDKIRGWVPTKYVSYK